ncbi:MAG: Cdc6/Cdc18 family protein [Candidatus Kariarchaeaceae archaeon]
MFKDRDKLRATYVPENLPHRTREITALAQIMGPVMAGGTPSNAFLYGKPGSGKTATTKYVLNTLSRKANDVGIPFKYAYINNSLVDTDYRVYVQLCEAVDVDAPPTGLPTDEVIARFTKALEAKGVMLVCILDEIDLLMKKSTKALYGLTRMNTDLNNSKISLIGITNSVHFKDTIDARVRSTLTEQEIVFAPYNAPQLEDILRERTEEGFEINVVSEPALKKAAAMAASEHGDARRALDLLRVAGETAENDASERVMPDHVDQANSIIERNTVREVVLTLPTHTKIVLLSVLMLDQNKKKNEFISTGDTYDTYIKLCQTIGYAELTQRRVGDLINELDVLGMVRANVVSKGRYGRTRVINLDTNRHEILQVLKTDSIVDEIIGSFGEETFVHFK